MDDSPDDLLSVGEAALVLHVSAQTIRRWHKLGRLPAVRTPGNQRRFRRFDVLAALRPDEPTEAAS